MEMCGFWKFLPQDSAAGSVNIDDIARDRVRKREKRGAPTDRNMRIQNVMVLLVLLLLLVLVLRIRFLQEM